MTIHLNIDEHQEKSLSLMAKKQGISLHAFIEELLNSYISEKQETLDLMRLSEQSFKEWDNEADSIYDRL
ncbi:MAG: hypothetical protein SFU91_15050 [Chloroherpetonaceae bacterium]|nr:hypothetical protein [Chloroherpetonaceae bacterium]